MVVIAAASASAGMASAQCTVANCPAGSNIVTSPPYIGTAGPDCFIGTANADIMQGQGGDDFICGGGGNDTIFGGSGNDTILGEDGNDNIFGEGDVDNIQGGLGDDTINGGGGGDFLFGEAGADSIDGDVGDDFIDGGDDDDQINGGDGNDLIFGGDGSDTLNGGNDNDTITGQAGNDDLFGGPGNDSLSGEAGSDILRGGDGDDSLSGGPDNDQLFGGNGADSLTGGGGNDILRGEAGDDPQLDGGDGEDTIDGGPGNDTANGGPGLDFINGGDDNDTLSGGDGPDIINGNGGDDILNGDADNDTLDGGAGTDNLFGNSGTDVCLNAANMDLSCESFTHAVLDSVAAFDDGVSTVVRWVTSSELGTVGFRVYRELGGEWVAVHDGLLPGLLSSPGGGVYELRDHGASSDEPQRYLVVEVDLRGNESSHGPFEVSLASRGESGLDADQTYARSPHPRTRLASAQKGLTSEKQRGGEAVAIYLGVEETGLYEVSVTEIAGRFAVDESEILTRIQSGDLRLTEAGQPVAWTPSPDGSALRFFGLARKSLYTTERIYRLSLESGDRMAERSAAPGAVTAGLTFDGHVHLEEELVPGVLVAQDPDSDYWFWQLVSAAPSMPTIAEVIFELESVAGGGALEVDLHGVGDDSHTVDVELNGVPLGTVFFEGVVPHQATLPVPDGVLENGSNTLTIAHPQAGDSQVYLNFADLTYTREYVTGETSLRFEGTADASLELTGLTGAVAALDITDARRPVRLTDVADAPSGAQLATESGLTYFALAESEVRAPSSIWNDVASDLRSESNAADYLVIAPAALLEGAEALAEHREAEGLSARVVELQDVFDEFAFGTPDPNAIRAFLQHAGDAWATPPSFVVLLGKGSFDYRDLLGDGGNLLPPLMVLANGGLLSSDTRFADTELDDGLPDLYLGRIPVTSAADLDAVIAQIEAYESGLEALTNEMTMLADATTDEGDFGAWADDATAVLPADWAVAPVYRSDLGDLESTRALLFDELERSPRVFGYLGHASLTKLGKTETLFEVADLPELALDGAQPIFADMTCVASRFAAPGFVSLGEAMLISDQGAIAVWGPSGLSINEQASPLLGALLFELSAPSSTRIGPMIDRAFRALDGSEHQREMVSIYHLFGDPALVVAKQGEVPGTGGSGGSSGTGGTAGSPGTGGTITTPEPRLVMAGCSAGDARPTAGAAFLLALTALLVGRRRRRI